MVQNEQTGEHEGECKGEFITMQSTLDISHIDILRYFDTPILCIVFFFFFLWKQRVIVPDEIRESYPGKNIYHKDPKFLDRHTQCMF